MKSGLIVLGAIGVVAAAANARPLYQKDLLLNGDNGAFAYFNQQIADDFTLSSDAAVGQATWYGNFFNSGDPFDDGTFSFMLRFYADAGGVPADTAFSEREVSATLFDTGVTQSGDRIYRFSTTFPAVSLSGGVKYYLNVEEVDANTPKPSFRWNNGGNDIDDDVMFFNQGTGWNTSGDPRGGCAFTLDVPAPSGVVLGFAGLIAANRRRR